MKQTNSRYNTLLKNLRQHKMKEKLYNLEHKIIKVARKEKFEREGEGERESFNQVQNSIIRKN